MNGDDWDSIPDVAEDGGTVAVAPPPKVKVVRPAAKPAPVQVEATPAVEPVPAAGWRADPEYVRAVAKLDELAGRLAGVRAERVKLDDQIGTDKAGDSVEAQARRLLAGEAGTDMAGRRERRDGLLADEKVLTRAVQLARAEADAVRDRAAAAGSVERFNAEYLPLARRAGAAYLEFARLATEAFAAHRRIVAEAGPLTACEFSFFVPAGQDGAERWGVWPAVLATAHEQQGVCDRFVSAGLLTAAEVSQAFPAGRG